MDTFSHALWGYGLFGYRGRPGVALFFGAFPDLVSFGLFMAIRIVQGTFELGKPSMDIIPDWLHVVYACSHSLVIAACVIGVIATKFKPFAFAMSAWAFHILLDSLSHSKEFFPTELFWPFSDFSVDAIAWSTPWVWYSNLAGLGLLLLLRVLQARK